MRKADNLPPYWAVVKKSAIINFSELCGPVQACYGTALRFTSRFTADLVQDAQSYGTAAVSPVEFC